VNVFCLGVDQIDSLWSEYGHHLERYEEAGYDFAGHIRQDLRAATKQLWGIQDDGRVIGVVVTKIVDTPRGAVCEVHAACGTSAGLSAAVDLLLPHVERWAKEHECVGMKIVGRNGWKRVLNDYRQTGVVLEKGF
jgi:hypothetical protein